LSFKGNTDRAIADYNEAIRLDSRFAHAFYIRGTAYEAKNDLAQALTDFRSFVRLNPNDPKGPEAILRIESKIDARLKK